MIEKAKSKVEALFKQYSEDEDFEPKIINRGYAISEVKKRDILFMGINSSYTKGWKPEHGFTYDFEDGIKQYPKYFAKFKELVELKGISIKDSCSYLDMFYYRETDQKVIDRMLRSETGVDFIYKQVLITQELIESIKPKIIMICNSRVAPFTGVDYDKETKKNEWMGYDFEFDEQFGVQVISGKIDGSETNLIGTPVVFASTLTYMSKYIKELLAWQLSNVYRNYEKNFGKAFK